VSKLKQKIRELLRINESKHISKAIYISAYTDASWHPTDKQGGWGMWGRDDYKRILASGPCPPWADDPNLNELCGVAASVKICVNHLASKEANILIIKTDSQSVCQWFGWKGGVVRDGAIPEKIEAKELVRRALETVDSAGLKLVVRWVKGHRGHVDIKGYLNDRVDGMAKIARKSRKFRFWSVIVDSKEEPIKEEWGADWVPWLNILNREV
jgi:ribonuclease HI